VKNGVPFSVVFDGCESLSPYELMAFSVVFSEIEVNSTFNWFTHEFVENK
jgi:hypothetical protein